MNNERMIQIMGMTFWDTAAGYRLAEVLTHSLPKIAEGMKNSNRKVEQDVAQMPAAEVHNYLRTKLLDGHKLIQAIPVTTENGTEYVVVTE